MKRLLLNLTLGAAMLGSGAIAAQAEPLKLPVLESAHLEPLTQLSKIEMLLTRGMRR